MLLDFSVSNFRSFADPTGLSMFAQPSVDREDTDFAMPTINAGTQVLTTSVIVGANGSGKTNFFEVIRFFKEFVLTSANASNIGKPIAITQNISHEEDSSPYSTFTITIEIKGTPFEYGFSCDKEKIYSEHLFEYPKGIHKPPKKFFVRETDNKGIQTYRSSRSIPNSTTIKKFTRANALFLSTAVSIGCESLDALFDFIKDGIHLIPSGLRIHPSYSTKFYCSGGKDAVIGMFNSFDVPITNLTIPDYLSNEIVTSRSKNVSDDLRNEIYFNYKTQNGKILNIPLKDEALRNQILFGLIGPIFDVLSNGYTLIIDELNSSIHASIIESVCNIFSSCQTNYSGAQLLFSTHDTSILNSKYVFRDQIWIMEKNQDQHSLLTPLSDFDTVENSDFGTQYLVGLFGGIPITRDLPGSINLNFEED